MRCGLPTAPGIAGSLVAVVSIVAVTGSTPPETAVAAQSSEEILGLRRRNSFQFSISPPFAAPDPRVAGLQRRPVGAGALTHPIRGK